MFVLTIVLCTTLKVGCYAMSASKGQMEDSNCSKMEPRVVKRNPPASSFRKQRLLVGETQFHLA